jgi:hypothetical protein
MAKMNFLKRAQRASGKPMELMFSVVAGAAINTNIAVSAVSGVTGATETIKRGDGLLAVIDFQDTAGGTAGVVGDRVGETSITSDGNIQLTTTNTTNHGLLVIWQRNRT